MLERQEIDALLISALYGELSPAEESRLAAHFEAHPADKTALAALTSTREAVRESRILQVQVEPPQSVSALLMQEAARRAPTPPEKEGWFARFTRSFMAHPAMAAAMMLVVVLGVATFVRNRKGDEMVENHAPASAERAKLESEGSAALATPPSQDSFPDASVAQGQVGAGSGSAAAGSDAYAVSLADDTAAKNAETVKADELAQDRQRRDLRNVAEPQIKVAGTKGKDAPPAAQDAKKSGAKAPTGAMELRRPDPSPKELDDTISSADYERLSKEQSVNAITPPSAGPGGVSGGGAVAGRGDNGGYAVPPPAGNTATGSTTATVTQKVPPADPSNNAKAPDAKPTDTRATTTSPAPQAPSRVTASPPRNQGAAPATPAPPPPAKTEQTAEKPRAAAPAEDKSANDPQLAWAREQHNAIIGRVRAGDCKGAANLALGLWNRDPAYYQQNVATDRSVKDCQVYISQALDRDASERAERSKAAKQQQRQNEPAKRSDSPKASAIDSAK